MLTDFFPGSQFRQYKLLEQIGVGGIGLVWSALDQIQNFIVAIKLNKIDEENQAVNYMMLDRHITGLHHPNIMPTYDFGIWKNIQYIVTPYIPGGSLEDRISERVRIPIPEALQYMAEIGSALDYLHSENVIHRDLKPANILINFNRHLYVADFDLARILSQTTQSMHTGRGTPAYAPPEQHTKAAITPRSDIFSLGIVLYEMFTLQLPWNGEKSLGIQQLSSDIEIPDPREENPDLPAGLVNVLRKMSATIPENRPSSVSEALRMVYSSFNVEPIIISDKIYPTEAEIRRSDSVELLKRSFVEWETSSERVVPNLTRFAYIDLNYRLSGVTLPSATLRFMLNTALIFRYQDDYWWDKLKNPKERLAITSKLVNKNNEIGAERIVEHLYGDREILALKGPVPKGMVQNLVDIACKTKKEGLRDQILVLLRSLLQKSRKWRDSVIGFEEDTNIAQLALRNDATGDKAALLIGHLHSKSAVDTVLKTASADRLMPAMKTIHWTAGSLPVSIPFNLRLAVDAEWLQKIITEQPLNLLFVFLVSFAGTTLGTSLQTYLSYRLPSFLDLERIAISIERGGFIGLVFGLGIVVTRLIAERFSGMDAFPRVALATLSGGLGLNIGIFTYDVLFLKNTPAGNLITLACLLIAFGFALAALSRILVVKILISFVSLFLALAGSWWLHTILATGPTGASPIFFYEYTWPPAQVSLIVLLVSLPIAVLGNLFDISLTDLN